MILRTVRAESRFVGQELYAVLTSAPAPYEHGQVVELEDTRRSERRAHCGVGVRVSPWLLESCQWAVVSGQLSNTRGMIAGANNGLLATDH